MDHSMGHHDHSMHDMHHGGMSDVINVSAIKHGGPRHGGLDYAADDSGSSMHHHHSDSMHSMTFHGGTKEVILFAWWSVEEFGPFIGSFIGIFIMAVLYEGLKYYRKHLLWQTYTGLQYCAVAPPSKGVTNACATDDPTIVQPLGSLVERKTPTMMSKFHAWQTFLHAIQVFISYLLMLIFMTYNTWLCMAVVLGSATGYFLFGWKESVVVDFTEHCH